MTTRRLGGRRCVLIALVALIVPGCDSPPSVAAPQALWELAGFSTPESALPDGKTGVIYVSNVAGSPTDKDGNGFISKVSRDGKMITDRWVTGLDAPKGLALVGNRLFVSDIDHLIEIDTATATVVARHEAAGSKFLNDVAADAEGRIYVSDMATNTIWRLADGKFESWLDTPDLANPNGVLVDGETLVVGAWGVMTDGFATKVPGHVLAVSLSDKSVTSLGSDKPLGNLDGVEPLGPDAFLVSDWMAGKIFRVARSGEAVELMSLGQGTADIGYDPATATVYVPMMKDNVLKAFKIE